MGKRKLSLQQRQTIRKEIRQLITQKKKQSEILRAMAAKYHITPITARWYYKSLVRPGKQAPKAKLAPRGGRKAVRRGRIHSTNGAALRIVQHVQTLADKSYKRVVEAKKLIPKWQVYVKKEASLRKLQGKVRSALRTIASKATALHRRIKALTSN